MEILLTDTFYERLGVVWLYILDELIFLLAPSHYKEFFFGLKLKLLVYLLFVS